MLLWQVKMHIVPLTVCNNTHNIIPIFNNESYKDIGGDSCICALMAVSKSLGDIFSAI